MKKKLLFRITFLMFLFFAASQSKGNAKSDYVTINFEIGANMSFRLRYLDEMLFEQKIDFGNKLNSDSLFTQTIKISKPTLFWYRMLVGNKVTKNAFILSPGDNVYLKLEGNYHVIAADKNPSLLINNYLKNFNPWDSDYNYKTFSEKEMVNYFFESEKEYRANLAKIDSLAKTGLISEKTTYLWRIYSQTSFFNKVLNTTAYFKNNVKNTLIDKEISNYNQTFSELIKINSPDLVNTAFSLITYQAFLEKKDINDISNYTNLALEKNLGKLSTKYCLTRFEQYQDKLNPEFLVNWAKLEKYADSSYIPILDTLKDSYTGNILASESILFKDFTGKEISFKHILDENKSKIVVLDFWATWCIPCRNQMPFLKKIEYKLRNNAFAFVKISIDDDSTEENWRAALYKEQMISDNKNYRLLSPRNSLLRKFYRIDEIPRYMVFNKKGKLLNSEFLLPTDPNFEKKLLDYEKSQGK